MNFTRTDHEEIFIFNRPFLYQMLAVESLIGPVGVTL